MSNSILDGYMLAVSIYGNLFLYIQVLSLIRQRRSIHWNDPGRIPQIISYFVSILSCISWIVYSIIQGNMTIVIVSSAIALSGSSLCLIVITITSCLNGRLITPESMII